MSASLSLPKLLLAPLTFNQDHLFLIGNDENTTPIAFLLVFANGLISGLNIFTNNTLPIPGFELIISDQKLIPTMRFLLAFIFQLLFLLTISHFIKIASGWLGAKRSTTMQVFRMIGFASLWLIINSLIGLVISLGNFNFIFILLFLTAFSIGYASATETSPVRAMFASIIGYFLAFTILGVMFFVLLFFLLGFLIVTS